MVIVKIGCCGFPFSRSRYFREYRVVELQNTFYDLPTLEWVEKLRSEAPDDFEFTIKAWQAISHPSSSPTWKKMRRKPGGELNNYGYLKPTRENFDALTSVIEVAEKLRCRIIVFQTPASMPYNEESIKWVDEFFAEAKKIAKGMILGWEPRGEWARHSDLLKEILGKHGILHVTDLFRYRPVNNPNGILYTRLHGIGKGEVNYRYKYTVDDYRKLLNILESIEFNEAYIMFNNVKMAQDSQELRKFLEENSSYEIM